MPRITITSGLTRKRQEKRIIYTENEKHTENNRIVKQHRKSTGDQNYSRSNQHHNKSNKEEGIIHRGQRSKVSFKFQLLGFRII